VSGICKPLDVRLHAAADVNEKQYVDGQFLPSEVSDGQLFPFVKELEILSI